MGSTPWSCPRASRALPDDLGRHGQWPNAAIAHDCVLTFTRDPCTISHQHEAHGFLAAAAATSPRSGGDAQAGRGDRLPCPRGPRSRIARTALARHSMPDDPPRRPIGAGPKDRRQTRVSCPAWAQTACPPGAPKASRQSIKEPREGGQAMTATRQGRALASTTHQSRPGIVRRHPASASCSASIAPPSGRPSGAHAQTIARHCQAPPFLACPTAEMCVCPPQAMGWAHARARVRRAAGKRGFSGVWLASRQGTYGVCAHAQPLSPAIRNYVRGRSNVTRNQVGRMCNGRPDLGNRVGRLCNRRPDPSRNGRPDPSRTTSRGLRLCTGSIKRDTKPSRSGVQWAT